ncbi:FMN-binding protein [Agromyces bauzanensis]|uniref:FMN-binding domain-containing protein n=1 Tax=Agromyces bauzanensis TaxID=1308924 RepID=A0A917PGL7_9MICO|nr:FMN-binding protein [Agromyces bauzanensis]GGJ75874.1 hypothetical protein GCM10011372_12680 [Agromyces bauzanensis]
MRRRAAVLASAASAVVILGGWQLGAMSAVTSPVVQGSAGTGGGSNSATDAAASGADAGTGTGSSTGSATGRSGTSTGAGATGGATATAPQAAASGIDGTYTGATMSTRFGNVQVQVTVSGGAITDVSALHLTDADRRSVQISNRAAPVLRNEVLQAQSASVSMVSGATYTSMGYLRSLQSALDQAGF